MSGITAARRTARRQIDAASLHGERLFYALRHSVIRDTNVGTRRRAPVTNESPFSDEGLPRALWWDDAAGVLRLLDQTLLPGRCEVIACATVDAVAEAIRALRVRGAPAIGVAAAYGLALAARALITEARGIDGTAALERLHADAVRLRATRPTAVNLSWALERMLAVA